MKNKIVFFGTPSFAAHVLEYLARHHVSLAAVVTQPDRPKGRSLQVGFSAVKQTVLDLQLPIPVLQPEKASDPFFLESLENLHADLYVVVAYGQILSSKLLAIPRLGCINVHASLLPKYRGAAPIQRCLMDGVKETGVAVQKMVRQLDAGDVIASEKIKVGEDTTFGELEENLCNISKPLLFRVLELYEQGIPPAESQDHEMASYAAKIDPSEAEIDWSLSAQQIHNKIRAFSPRPGAWTWLVKGQKRLKILRSRVIQETGKKGDFLHKKPIVACGKDALELLEVQPEGKKIMSGSDWLRGWSSLSSILSFPQ